MNKKYTNSTVDCVFNKESGNFLDIDMDLIQSDINDIKDKIKKTSFFYNLDDIGLNEGNETIEEIAENIPQTSILIYHKFYEKGNNSIYPKGTGLLQVTKGLNTNRVKFEFINNEGYWIGFYSNVDVAWSGWKMVSFNGDLKTIASLGLDENAKLEDVIQAMDDNTEIYLTTAGSFGYTNILSQLPTTSGILYIYKSRITRVIIEFTPAQNGQPISRSKFIGNYDDTNKVLGEWSCLWQGSGDSNSRPPKVNRFIGMQYFDTSLNKPIWWNGASWVDSNGASI